MVDGALGHEENEAPRLVKSPWFDHEVPFDLAAETGTRCVIREHATIGLVVTTDGSVADLPREAYLDAERRIIAELNDSGKPYVILLNCAEPDSDDARRLATELAERYAHAVVPLNCTTMTVETLDSLLQTLLYEFPIREIAVRMPGWVTMLESGHWLQSAIYTAMLEFAASVHKMADLAGRRPQLGCEYITSLVSRPGWTSWTKPAFCPASSAWPGPSAPTTRSNPPSTRSKPPGTGSSCRASTS